MADASVTLQSAVSLPDPEEAPTSPSGTLKRRQPSGSESGNKRPRRESIVQDQPQDIPVKNASISPKADRHHSRQDSGQAEERKRGRRMLSGLLGILQNSNAGPQHRRRPDFEKRQQRMKEQAEKYDEEKRKELEELKVVRVKEQKKYERLAMKTRHSNLLATANFLQTNAEPRLYYKPWELLPEEEIRISDQLRDTETLIQNETQDFDESTRQDGQEEGDNTASPHEHTGEGEKVQDPPQTSEPVGSDTHPHKPSEESSKVDATNQDPSTTTVPEESTIAPVSETRKAQEEDNGEVVMEGEEDTVIY
ncbi:MAG: hypothetical protein M1834_000749 [Cirrosporium novae-zelandiae]|nr:MAG: hypothetical protein M1834_000749 [Cirrosporium novae-zelandiae]